MTLSMSVIGAALLFLSACTKGDKVAAYVEIPSVEVVTTSDQGASTSKITDAWVSLDDRFLGVWELPARIPMLGEGTHKVTVAPAIKRNGYYDDRLRYPFYASSDVTADLVREGTAVVHPQCSYIPEASFWIEAFEDAFMQFDVTDDSDTTLERFLPSEHPELIYLGNSPCGGFRLDAGHQHMRIFTDEDYDVYGGPVFLELDYRCNVPITLGVNYTSSGVPMADPFVYINPTSRSDGSMPWNKIYIDLSPAFNLAFTERDLYIEADLPAGQAGAEVYLDNFKIVRMNS